MKPVKHPSNNRTLSAPLGWDKSKPPVAPLPITDSEIQGMPVMLSYWRPDAVDLAVLNAGGLLSLSVAGTNLPPVSIITTGEAALAGTSPLDIGSDLFIDVVMPLVRGLSNANDMNALASLYSGFISAAYGSLAADFGWPTATMILERIMNSVANSPPIPTTPLQ